MKCVVRKNISFEEKIFAICHIQSLNKNIFDHREDDELEENIFLPYCQFEVVSIHSTCVHK